MTSLLFVTSACFGINAERQTLTLDDNDLHIMAQRMAESIAACPALSAPSGATPSVAIDRIRNETNQVLSQEYREQLVRLLSQHAGEGVAFVLPEGNDRPAQLAGGSPGEAYRLQGTFYAHTRVSATGRSDYVLCTFRLVGVPDGGILWEDSYEVKRAAQRALFD